MVKPSGANSFSMTESAAHLLETLDANKTTTVFAVVDAPKNADEPGDFMGIISRQRYGHAEPAILLLAPTATDAAVLVGWQMSPACHAYTNGHLSSSSVLTCPTCLSTFIQQQAPGTAGYQAVSEHAVTTVKPQPMTSMLLYLVGCGCSVLELVAKHGDTAEAIDMSNKVEIAPVVIPPGMPLTFIYNVMQEQGLNYVPVIRQHGPLEGMVSRCVMHRLCSWSFYLLYTWI